jgi:hypothetical protein
MFWVFTVLAGGWLPSIRRNILPPSSGCFKSEDHNVIVTVVPGDLMLLVVLLIILGMLINVTVLRFKGTPRIHSRTSTHHTIDNRGADKSLARPGRTQTTATEDFKFHISYL